MTPDSAAEAVRKLVTEMRRRKVGAASIENMYGGGIIVTEDDITFKGLCRLLKVIEKQREETPWNVAGDS